MDVQSGLLAGASDQTRPQRRCRRLRRAAGMQARAGTDRGWYSRRVVILEGRVPWHLPSLVRDQLGRRRCGGSPASRGLADLGVTGLSAARLRAGTTMLHPRPCRRSARAGPIGAPVKHGGLTSREPRWAAPTQLSLTIPASGPAGGDAGGRTADYHPRDSETTGPGAGQRRTRSAGCKVIRGRVGSGQGPGPCSRGFVPVRRQQHSGPSSFPLDPRLRCKATPLNPAPGSNA